MRQWIRLVEELIDNNNSEDIDYATHWKEIIKWPETNSSVSVEEQIKNALEHSGAKKITLPNHPNDIIYITDDDIISIDEDGKGGDVTDKQRWIWDIDPSDYFPNYETKWNNDFWENPIPLYHTTTEENIAEIQEEGLVPMNKTRGISNRGVGSAVFTTSEYEEALGGLYGNYIFEIDMTKMAHNPKRPFVSEEPPVVEAELRNSLANYIGMDDFENDTSSDMSPYTVIVYGSIPPDCLTLVQK